MPLLMMKTVNSAGRLLSLTSEIKDINASKLILSNLAGAFALTPYDSALYRQE
jgi:hypothetical protein